MLEGRTASWSVDGTNSSVLVEFVVLIVSCAFVFVAAGPFKRDPVALDASLSCSESLAEQLSRAFPATRRFPREQHTIPGGIALARLNTGPP